MKDKTEDKLPQIGAAITVGLALSGQFFTEAGFALLKRRGRQTKFYET